MCDLLPYEKQPGRCARCGAPLTGRQTRWCGETCKDYYERNHYWQLARPAALRRDLYRCRRCGWSPLAKQLTLFPELDKRYADLEVNHVIPRVGRGYNSGCHHHLSNLEVLCHGCHLKVTRRQRIARSRIRSRRRDKTQELTYA